MLKKTDLKLKTKKAISILIVFCVIFSVSFFTSCKRNDTTGKNFRFPLEQDPAQLDPQSNINSSATAVIMSLFEGLTRLDEDGQPIPAMGSWTVSSDNLKYTFTIVDTFWSDYKTKNSEKKEIPGTKVTANDFVFGIKRSLSKNNPLSFAAQLFDIKNAKEVYEGSLSESELGVTALSDNQLIIELAQPNPNFPVLLSTPPFMPCNEAFFISTSGRYGMDGEFLLTNGPFKLRAWNPNESVLLNKHLGYYGAAEILPNAVRYVLGEPNDPITALENEEIDAAQLGKNLIESAKEKKLVLNEQNDLIKTLLFNSKNLHLSNASVRNSLRDSIEWDLVSRHIQDTGSSLSQGFFALQAVLDNGEVYRNDQNSLAPKMNIEKAKADWTNYLKDKKIESIKGFKLLTADDEQSVALARTIAQSWQKHLSFYCELEIVPSNQLPKKLRGDYAFAIYDIVAGSYYAEDSLAAFATSSPLNLTNFSNAAYDAMVNDLLSGKDSREAVESVEKYLWDLCPAVPISNENRTIALSKNCVGVLVRPFGGGLHGATYDFRKAGKTK